MFAQATTRARPRSGARAAAQPLRTRRPQVGVAAGWNFAATPTFAPTRRCSGSPWSGVEMPRRCAACEQDEQSARRVDSGSTDESLEYPRQEGSEAADPGFTPAPAPPVFPPNPPPPGNPAPAADCCTAALNAGLDRGDWGGIICCNNVKRACVWQSNINRTVTNSTAQGIVGGCVLVHEQTHLNQVDCTGAAVERPNFKPGVDPKQAECNAYQAEASCYANNIGNCGADADCKTQVQAQWDFAKQQIRKYC